MNRMVKGMIVISIIALFGAHAYCTDVALLDMDTLDVYTVTSFFTALTEIPSIRSVAAVDTGGGEGDEWLVFSGGGRISVVDVMSMTVLCAMSEAEYRALFSLGSGSGMFSSLTAPSGAADLLLYADDAGAGRYELDCSDFSFGPYGGEPLPRGFVTGFSYTSATDIGLLVRSDSGGWSFRDRFGVEEVPLDLEVIFQEVPEALAEMEVTVGDTVYRYLLAVLPGAGGTPTPTPTSTPPTSPTPTSTPSPPPDFNAVIANGLGENIWVVDGLDYHVVPGVADTGQAPNQVVVGEHEFYIVNSLSNSISVYDNNTYQVIPGREIALGAGRNPFLMALADDGTAYVTNFLTNTVSHVDLVSGHIIGEIGLPDSNALPHDDGVVTWARPEGICIVGDTVYTACANLDDTFVAGGPGLVCTIDVSSDQYTGYFLSGGRDTVAVNRSSAFPERLWIASAGDYDGGYLGNGCISIWSVATGTLTDVIPIDGAPFELAFGSERLYIADGIAGVVNRLDLDSLSVLTALDFPGTAYTDFVSGLSVDPRGILWVLTFNSDQLFLLDTYNGDALIQSGIDMGDGPDAVAVVPVEGRI